mmetsp:Transcript_5492/g.17984  ORF Transcript_5492/g.17984 Transcript_5492/m.17984 type:complete len:326 (-) Transcript_5492:233-1210(-)
MCHHTRRAWAVPSSVTVASTSRGTAASVSRGPRLGKNRGPLHLRASSSPTSSSSRPLKSISKRGTALSPRKRSRRGRDSKIIFFLVLQIILKKASTSSPEDLDVAGVGRREVVEGRQVEAEGPVAIVSGVVRRSEASSFDEDPKSAGFRRRDPGPCFQEESPSDVDVGEAAGARGSRGVDEVMQEAVEVGPRRPPSEGLEVTVHFFPQVVGAVVLRQRIDARRAPRHLDAGGIALVPFLFLAKEEGRAESHFQKPVLLLKKKTTRSVTLGGVQVHLAKDAVTPPLEVARTRPRRVSTGTPRTRSRTALLGGVVVVVQAEAEEVAG